MSSANNKDGKEYSMLIIPIYDSILLPDVTFYFRKEVVDSWKVDELVAGQEIVFALLKDDIDADDVIFEDVFPIGVSAKVESVDSEGSLKIRTLERVNIKNLTIDQNGDLDGEVEVRPEIDDLPVDEKNKRFDELRTSFLRFVKNYQWGLWASSFILQW